MGKGWNPHVIAAYIVFWHPYGLEIYPARLLLDPFLKNFILAGYKFGLCAGRGGAVIVQMRRQLKSMPWLWIAVAISMAWAPGFWVFFKGSDLPRGRLMGRINSLPITMEKFYQVKAQEQLYRSRLASFGFEQFAGPVELPHVLSVCSRDVLVDNVASALGIEVDDNYLRKSIVNNIGKELIKSDGTVNVEAYQQIIRSMFSSGVEEYEREQRHFLARRAVRELIKQAAYEPEYVRVFDARQAAAKKSFEIVTVPFSHFEREAAKGDLGDELLKKYYEAHQHDFMTEEHRVVRFADLPTKGLGGKVDVNDFEVAEHYERYRDTRFLKPAQYQVRYALFAAGATDAENKKVKAVAEKTRSRIVDSKGENDLTVVARYEGKEAGIAVTAKLTSMFKVGDKTVSPVVERSLDSLQKEGSITGLLESSEGIYLVQLFKKVAAAPRPFDDVKGEIQELIKKRKEAHAIRMELEQFVRAAHEDSSNFDSFIKERGLTLKSAEYSEHDLQLFGQQKNSLVKQVFDWKREVPYVGYVPATDSYTLFSLDKVIKPQVRPFAQVKEEVKRGYIAQEAKRRSVQFAKDMHQKLLHGDTTVAELASKYDFELIKTGMLGADATLSKPKDNGSLLIQMRLMTDKHQALSYQNGQDLCLVQLVGQELPKDGDTKKLSALRDERLEFDYEEGFIASMLRDAKIEFGNNSDVVELPHNEE